MQADQRRPEVTLIASSLPLATGPVPGTRRRRDRPLVALALLPLLALVLALTTGGQPPPPPPPAPVVDADLLLLGDRLTSSQTGVLVLPVELQNRGAALQVSRVMPYGFPLRADPQVQAPQDVPAGERRRFVMLIAPDCGLLDAGSNELFEASLLVRVTAGPTAHDLLLDLSADRLVRERVMALCA